MGIDQGGPQSPLKTDLDANNNDISDVKQFDADNLNNVIVASPGDDLQSKADAASGGTLFLSPGTYTDNSALIESKTNVIGAGADSVIWERTVDSNILRTKGDAGVEYRNITVKGIRFNTKTVTNPSTWPLKITNGVNVTVRDCVFDNDLGSNAGVGGVFVNKNGSSPTYHVKILDNHMRNGSIRHGSGVGDSRIAGNIVWAKDRDYGIRIDDDNYTIAHNHIVPSPTNGGLFAPIFNKYVRVIGNFIDGGGSSFTTGHGIHADGIDNWTIGFNTFWRCNKCGIRTDDSFKSNIGFNIFYNCNSDDNANSDIELAATDFSGSKIQIGFNWHENDQSLSNPGHICSLIDNGGGFISRVKVQSYGVRDAGGYVDESVEATGALQLLVNGRGTNAGDPNSGGQWSGADAYAYNNDATVEDTTNSTLYKAKSDGTWSQIGT